MATRNWLGGAAAVPQVNSVTPASVGIGNVFTISVNGKSVSYPAAAATVADVTAGLANAVAASLEPEFRELAAVDKTTYLQLTGPADGAPFVQSSSATGGTATLVTATATAAAGPNDWSVAANWSGGAVPVTGDDVNLAGGRPGILYGLDQSAVTLASLTDNGFTGGVGLPERSDTGYSQYRDTYLKIGITTANIRSASPRWKLNTLAIQTTLTVLATGSSQDAGLEAFLWKGTHAANVLNLIGGSVAVAALPGETAAVATLRAGAHGSQGGVQARVGAGCVPVTVVQYGGTLTLEGGAGTGGTAGYGGTLELTGGNITGSHIGYPDHTLNVRCGATLANLAMRGGLVDLTLDPRPKVVNAATLKKGSAVRADGSVTWSGNPFLDGCDLTDLREFTIGFNRTLVIA